jgi:hypothetical protein
MTDPPRWQPGDRLRLRKAHACGGDTWRLTRTGADMGLECLTCGRRVMLDRETFNRRVKERVPTAEVASPAGDPPGQGALP